MKGKHIRKVLLLVAITILLIGLASAATTNKTSTNKDTKIIKENTKNIKTTPTATKKVNTKTVTNNKTQNNKKIKTTQKETNRKIDKNKEKNTKTEIEPVRVNDWESLTNAIGQVTSNTTIKLEEGLYNTTQTINIDIPSITIIIDGNGQTINGTQKQVFTINEGSSLVLKNITITNAQTKVTGYDAYVYGGAINNYGNLTIISSTLTNNQAIASASFNNYVYGGAIHNNGNLTITQSTLTNNQAIASAGASYAYAYGGAIHNNGNLTITNSTLTNNQATSNGFYAYAYGGAIHNSGNLTITQSTLTNNQVTTTPVGDSYTHVDFDGGAIYTNNDYYNITDTTFFNNNPANFIINSENTIKFTEEDGSFISIGEYRIMADGEKITAGNGQTDLESVEMPRGDYVEIILNGTDEKTTNNHFVLRSNIAHVYNYPELVEAIKTAQSEEYNKYIINLLNLLPGNYNATENITWLDSATKNLIINGNDITLNGKQEYQFIQVGSELNLTLSNITITNYTATSGGAIENYGNLTISYSTFIHNKAILDDMYADGGAIYSEGKVIVINSNFKENQAISKDYHSRGGAITANDVEITNSNFINNNATEGGAIYSWETLNVINSNFTQNTAIDGGAIYGCNVNISISNLTQNTATGMGGAIYVQGDYDEDYCEIVANKFEDNNATEETIFIRNTVTKIIKDNIYKNTTVGFTDFLLNIDSSKTEFLSTESLPLNITAFLLHPDWYDENILNQTTYEVNVKDTESFNVTNTSFTVDLTDYKGKYTVKVYSDIFQTSNDIEFTVLLPTSISMKLINNIMGNVIINVDVKDINNEYVTSGVLKVYNDDNEIASIQLKGKSENITLDINQGEQTLKLEYKANNNNYYLNSTFTEEVTIVSATSITLTTSTVYIGDSVVFNGTLKDYKDRGLNTNIDVTINNKKETVTVTDGKFQVKYTATKEETVQIIAEFLGDKYNLQSNTTCTFNVQKIDTRLSLVQVKNIYVGDKFTLNITLTDNNGNKLSNKTVLVQINGESTTFTTDKNGSITYTENWKDNGTFKITMAFNGDDKYNPANNVTQTFKVEKINTKLTLAKVKNIYVGDKFTLNITLTDTNGNKLSNKTVQVQINKESTTFNTDKNGSITYTENWKDAGTFKITISFNGDTKYNPASNVTQTFKVEKFKTTLKVKNQKIQNKDKVKLTATITDQNNKKVNTGKVIFKINGITIKDKNGKVIRTKVSNGKATITFTPNSKYYNKASNLTAVYTENNKYLRSENNAKLTLTPRDATIKLQITKIKATQYDTITIKTISKDKNKKLIKEGCVIFKINGKTLTQNGKTIKAKIKNGKATLKYNLNGHKTGKYTLTAVLSSNTYKKVSTKTTLKITEDKMHIVAKAVKTSKNKTRIKAKILDTKNKYIKTTIKVSFKIDQKTVAKQVKVKNGKVNVKIPTNVTKGKHALNIVAGPNYRYKVTRKNVSLIKT